MYHCALKIDGTIYEYGANYGARASSPEGRNLTCVPVQPQKSGCECDETIIKGNVNKAMDSGEWTQGNYNAWSHNCCHFVDQILRKSGCAGVTSYDYFSWWRDLYYLPPYSPPPQ